MKKIIIAVAAFLAAYMYGCHRGWVNHIDHCQDELMRSDDPENRLLWKILTESDPAKN